MFSLETNRERKADSKSLVFYYILALSMNELNTFLNLFFMFSFPQNRENIAYQMSSEYFYWN